MPANTFWLQNCLAGDNSLRCIDMRYYIASPKPALQYLDVSNCLLPRLLPHITGSEQGNIYFFIIIFNLFGLSDTIFVRHFPLIFQQQFMDVLIFPWLMFPPCSWVLISPIGVLPFVTDTHLGGGSQGNSLYFLFVCLNFCISLSLDQMEAKYVFCF